MDPEKDVAIADAVCHVLAEVGYSRFTMDDVAMAARVGKAAIYRRWPTKTDLLISYLESSDIGASAAPDLGSLRDDLTELLTGVCGLLNSPAGRANRTLLGVIHDDPALLDAYRRGPLNRWSTAFAKVFARAAARGEMRPEAATSVPAEAGPAILITRWFVTGQEVDEAAVVAVVDEVMLPLLCGT
ncbi:TetR/AcrR family transcriptional regulator [Trujillonella humicola]|uniref:TetR/AcrR family transcriptional regulator n=1 Tax=Trujillonella humicola TaxID=3383699 RepID=UPI0039059A01